MSRIIIIAGLIMLSLGISRIAHAQALTVPDAINLEGYKTMSEFIVQDVQNSELATVSDNKKISEEKIKIAQKYSGEIETCKEDVTCLKSVISKQNADVAIVDAKVALLKAKHGATIRSLNAAVATGALVDMLKNVPMNTYVIQNSIKVHRANNTRIITYLTKVLTDDGIVNLKQEQITVQGKDTLNKFVRLDKDNKTETALIQADLSYMALMVFVGQPDYLKSNEFSEIANIKVQKRDLK